MPGNCSRLEIIIAKEEKPDLRLAQNLHDLQQPGVPPAVLPDQMPGEPMGNNGASEFEYSSDTLALPKMQDLEEEQEQKPQQEAQVAPRRSRRHCSQRPPFLEDICLEEPRDEIMTVEAQWHSYRLGRFKRPTSDARARLQADVFQKAVHHAACDARLHACRC